MFAPIFQICAAYPPLVAVLGDDPVRFWPFGEAPQNETRPYAVWQTMYGEPDNHLNQRPLLDRWGIQVDAYAKTASAARGVAEVIRDAIEDDCYVVSWNGEFKDVPTGLFRYSFTVEFMTTR
jgi:hypothetical protein